MSRPPTITRGPTTIFAVRSSPWCQTSISEVRRAALTSAAFDDEIRVLHTDLRGPTALGQMAVPLCGTGDDNDERQRRQVWPAKPSFTFTHQHNLNSVFHVSAQ